MLKRVTTLLLAFPAAVLLLTFAVINRYKVVLVLNPFANSGEVADGLAQLNPVGEAAQQVAVEAAGNGFGIAHGLGVYVPLYMLCFLFTIFGLLAGGAASWLTQGKWRQLARQRTLDAHRWRAEADRLTKERDAAVAKGRAQLPAPKPTRAGAGFNSEQPALTASS